jgi:bifunctional non-homologous end joining protein LigD
VRLFTRRGFDWTDRYPAIAGAAAKLTARSFTIDGEAVVCGPDGIAVFEALHRRQHVSEAILYAFDLLELNGECVVRDANGQAIAVYSRPTLVEACRRRC